MHTGPGIKVHITSDLGVLPDCFGSTPYALMMYEMHMERPESA